jgi:hypothetical protein
MMIRQIRIVSFITLFLTALFFPLWVFVPLAVLYTCMFGAYEIIIIGIYIDAQFGNPDIHEMWFLYTALTLSIVGVSLLVKPFLRFYTE